MDKARRNSTRYNMHYNNDKKTTLLTTPSNAEKIKDIRQQLEEVLASAYNKRTKKTPRSTKLSPIINDKFGSPSLSIRESRNEMTKNNPFRNDCVVPADAKLFAYKKFITSLTRIIQGTNRDTPDSFSMSTNINVENVSLDTQKKLIEEKGTYLIQKNTLTEPYSYKNRDMHIMHDPQCAEKMTYCRPVAYSQEFLSKTMEKNAKLQQLVKKLVQAREKEKQNEAWNNYINELKNKHGHYDFQTKNMSNSFGRDEQKTPIIIDDSYDVRHSWKRPNLCELMFNDLYDATDNAQEESNIRRQTWCAPSTSNKHYKYANNSFCCPMSSQGRLLMMKKETRYPTGYSLRQSRRYFRGSSIVVEKQSPGRKKSSMLKPCSTIKSQERTDILECRAIQTNESHAFNTNDSQMSDMKTKFKHVSNIAEKLKNKMNTCRENNKKKSLVKIEDKLDILIHSFNNFLEELKSKKMLTNVRSQAVSCSSTSCMKTKSDTYNVLTKPNIICEVVHQKPHTFPTCPINQDTINEILNVEKDKSNKVKNDIDKILNSAQCAVQITIDIPTKEHSTEVTNSFYKRQQKETIVEEIEPIEGEELEKIERSMTIAVNTDPMGILALFRLSAETVKQILSYVPNLDYVSYLARRQIGNSNAAARYICNICSASFTRPSALSDHIEGHNIANSKNCCVCRHVLDRLSNRSGLFACTHCGQIFTRAYCRELHEQTCSMADSRRRPRPSLVLLT